MMAPLEDEDIEQAARRLRIRLGIDDQLRPDMITVIIKLKNRGMIKNYVRVPDSEMPNDEARFDSDDQLLYIRESTFCAANAMYTYPELERRRARFTIAHEIGHIALGHKGIRFRGDSSERGKRLVGQIRQQERDAERFAAAFLAPDHLA
jgi:Zn-dependent peptidase ImmA (M78 family)